MPWASIVVYAGLRIEALAAYGRPGTGKRCRASQFWRGRRLGATPAPSAEKPAGTLRFAGAPRPGLLPPTTQKAQINLGLAGGELTKHRHSVDAGGPDRFWKRCVMEFRIQYFGRQDRLLYTEALDVQ